jgi:hypothetical protein
MLTLGLLIMGLLFTIVNNGLEEKYGEIQYFLKIDFKREKIHIGYCDIPIPYITIGTVYREGKYVVIYLNNRKMKIPLIINTPLLR